MLTYLPVGKEQLLLLPNLWLFEQHRDRICNLLCENWYYTVVAKCEEIFYSQFL